MLLDRPAVVEDFSPLERAGVRERCRIVGGDMLSRVPAGESCYLLKRVLCDMSDEDATTVLNRCASAVAPDGRVLIVEQDLGDAGHLTNQILDVLFLAVFGAGRVRSTKEYEDLLRRSGLTLLQVQPTGSPNIVLEAGPAC